MKKILILAATVLALAACNKKTTYTIQGNVEGVNGTVTLATRNAELATTEATDGAFTVTYKAEAPAIATLKAGDQPFAQVLLEEGTIVVGGKLEQPETIVVSGTPSNDAMTEIGNKMNEILAQYYDPSKTTEEREALSDSYDAIVNEAYEANKGANILGLYLLVSQKIYEMTPDEILVAVAGYPSQLQKTEELKSAKQQAEAMKKVAVGAKFIEIEQNDPEGNPIKLSDIVAKNRYTLVDFWASWCGPCMAEVPYLTADCAEYHSKGFEIYGISLDRAKENWVAAIAEKGLVWPNVSEVNMWDNTAAKAYAVRSIPSNFLVAEDGTIVATNLRGKALGEKLAELLK